MFSKLLLITGLTAHLVAADRLSTWLSDMCTNANMGTTDPLPLGRCIEFGQAQSYILKKDPGNVYNLFQGGGCSQYVGQVSLSGRCLAVGDRATGIMNIGPQDAKRHTGSMDQYFRCKCCGNSWEIANYIITISGTKYAGNMLRTFIDYFVWKIFPGKIVCPARSARSGANPLGRREKRKRNEPALEKRVEGDAYQCPNIPSGADYFFVVQRSSAVHGDTFADEDSHVRNDFVSAFNAAYQNPSGQNQVSSYTPLGGEVEDVQMTLTMNQGVIHDISPVDIENLTNSLFDFRDRQGDPLNFLVSIYTGRVDHPGAGPIAEFHWNGD
ncbi:hypothetical protein DFP72DRAFT_855982 [Ephemerocybe angulata]|uniref:Uncharacterized protein n=1 Tax=Ephemerocybe angulata TaxID=980116 RepID=A0A8H6HGL2_9AGAR|nr:hypothetical protein DFP72DRAFT_855982 [Tulosesus angulatus]